MPQNTRWCPITVDNRSCKNIILLISPQLFQKQCVTFVLIRVIYEPSLYENYHLQPMWQWCQSVSGLYLLKILISCQVLGFLRGRCRESLECRNVPYKKSYARRLFHSMYHEAEELTLRVWDQGGANEESIWGVSVNIMSDIQLPINDLGPCGQRQGT